MADVDTDILANTQTTIKRCLWCISKQLIGKGE